MQGNSGCVQICPGRVPATENMRINTLQECVSIGVCSGHESIALVLPIALPGPDPLPLLGGLIQFWVPSMTMMMMMMHCAVLTLSQGLSEQSHWIVFWYCQDQGYPSLPDFSGAEIAAKMLKESKRYRSLCVALATFPLPTELCCCINNGADTAPSGICFLQFHKTFSNCPMVLWHSQPPRDL